MGYLDGVKRSLDDPAYAQKILSQTSKITDPKLLEDSYKDGVKVWNKDMTVDHRRSSSCSNNRRYRKPPSSIQTASSTTR